MISNVLTSYTHQVLRAYQVGSVLDSVCYMDTYKRISRAGQLIGGRTLPKWSFHRRFCRVWGSIIGKDDVWMRIPKRFRGMGAPGALAMLGVSNIVRGPDIWRGALVTGAVLQAWKNSGHFRAVRNGNHPKRLLGHSFVFINYEYRADKIIGFRVADNRYHGNTIVRPSEWGVLIGANTISS